MGSDAHSSPTRCHRFLPLSKSRHSSSRHAGFGPAGSPAVMVGVPDAELTSASDAFSVGCGVMGRAPILMSALQFKWRYRKHACSMKAKTAGGCCF